MQKIDGIDYKENVDCFLVNGKWIPIKTNLVYDHYTKKKVSKGSTIQHGFVGKNEKGYFSKSPFQVESDTGELFLNRDIALANGYQDVWYNDFFSNTNQRPHMVRDYLVDEKKYDYYIINNIEKARKVFDEWRSQNPVTKLSRVDKLGKEMDYTYGIEIETSKGFVKQDLLARHGFMAAKDGSLRVTKNDGGKYSRHMYSLEYVSIPYSKAEGFYEIIEMVDILQQRTHFDDKCSFHVHLGGFERSRYNIVSLYSLLTKIQKEMALLFPIDRLYPEKGKEYCSLLSTRPFYNEHKTFKEYVLNCYRGIFREVSGRQPNKDYNNSSMNHPTIGDKWFIKQRYHWVNFVPYMFAKQKTVEFRIHTPTFNAVKIIYWILICNAILKYANKKGLSIMRQKTITLEDVLTVYSPELRQTLTSYIKERKSLYTKNPYSKQEYDLLLDKDYKFGNLI